MPAAPDSLGAIVAQALGTLTRAREGQHAQLRSREVGVVRTVSTGVAKISGLPGVGLDECVEFASGLPGIAFNIDEDAIGVVLLGESSDLEAGFEVTALFQTPNSVTGITPLISELLLAIEQQRERDGLDEVHIFHNQPRQRATYDPVTKRLLPFDAQWRRGLESIPWPTHALPEIIAGGAATLDALIREFLFVSLFRACAESLAAENARRFAAMQGAEQNINELMGTLTLNCNRQRQAAIDEELFDLIAGYEVLRAEVAPHS